MNYQNIENRTESNRKPPKIWANYQILDNSFKPPTGIAEASV